MDSDNGCCTPVGSPAVRSCPPAPRAPRWQPCSPLPWPVDVENWPSSEEQPPSHLAAASLLLQEAMQPLPTELLPCFQLAAQLQGCLSVSAAGPSDLAWAGALTAPWPSHQDASAIPCDSSEDGWSCHFPAHAGAAPSFQQQGAPDAFSGHKRGSSCISSNSSCDEACHLSLGLPPPAFAPMAACPAKRPALAAPAHGSSALAWATRAPPCQQQHQAAQEEEALRRLRVEQWLPTLHQACPPAPEDISVVPA